METGDSMATAHTSAWRSVGLPVLVAVLVVTVCFVAVTRWLDTQQAGGDRPTGGEPGLPATIHVPTTTVATTADHGPIGPVGAVFAVQSVLTGLTGEMTNPWVALSSLDGAARAISSAQLPPAARGAAVQVSADGRLLAWPASDSVVLYDPVQDSTRTAQTTGPTTLGAFSPDGSHLLVNDGTLSVLQVGSGDIRPLADDVPAGSTAGAAWSPDGREVTWVNDGLLRTAGPDGSAAEQRTNLPPTTMLAWSASGEELLSLDEDGGTLLRWSRWGDRLRRAGRVRQMEGTYLERLIGYTGDDRAAVIGLSRASGGLPQLMTLDLTSGAVDLLTALPAPGVEVNWVDTATLSFADDALAGGTKEFPAPAEVWSDRAVLTSLVIGVGCILGFYLVRRRRT